MDIDALSLRRMLELGNRAKRGEIVEKPLAGKHIAMIFEKPSTRTRVRRPSTGPTVRRDRSASGRCMTTRRAVSTSNLPKYAT